MEAAERVFWGTLFSDTDDFFLDSPDERRKVDFFVRQDRALAAIVSDEGLNRHKQVSILGHMGEDPRLSGPCLIAQNVVSHDGIAQRAFDIHEADGGSAFDNWLLAERQLLDS